MGGRTHRPTDEQVDRHPEISIQTNGQDGQTWKYIERSSRKKYGRTCKYPDRQTDKIIIQKDRWIDMQISRQTDGQTERQIGPLHRWTELTDRIHLNK